MTAPEPGILVSGGSPPSRRYPTVTLYKVFLFLVVIWLSALYQHIPSSGKTVLFKTRVHILVFHKMPNTYRMAQSQHWLLSRWLNKGCALSQCLVLAPHFPKVRTISDTCFLHSNCIPSLPLYMQNIFSLHKIQLMLFHSFISNYIKSRVISKWNRRNWQVEKDKKTNKNLVVHAWSSYQLKPFLSQSWLLVLKVVFFKWHGHLFRPMTQLKNKQIVFVCFTLTMIDENSHSYPDWQQYAMMFLVPKSLRFNF